MFPFHACKKGTCYLLDMEKQNLAQHENENGRSAWGKKKNVHLSRFPSSSLFSSSFFFFFPLSLKTNKYYLNFSVIESTTVHVRVINGHFEVQSDYLFPYQFLDECTDTSTRQFNDAWVSICYFPF